MKSFARLTSTIALLLAFHARLPAAGNEEGFVTLFPQEGPPAGWTVRQWNDLAKPADPGVQWLVKDGVLHGSEPRGTWLISEKEYGDFILEFDWKLGERGNGGTALRAPLAGDPAFDGLELQMVDKRYYPPEQVVTEAELTGSLYKAVPPREQVYQPEKWNHYRIQCQGSLVKVELNGKTILDVDLDTQTRPTKRHDETDAPPLKARPRKGHIGFQELSRGGGHVQIRNARLKELAPGTEPRAQIKDLNSPWTFPQIASETEWQAHARHVRDQARVSCGLWPMPEKTPLNARIFGRVEQDGYTVEKVAIETLPGFFLAGNLYRPMGLGWEKGPFPGILNPHGHWSNGRMADEANGSVAGRCINFARQGMVAFSYDMIGYNDTFFPDHGPIEPERFYIRHRRFATNEVNLLWNISQMGLQTWNSIRALDFLESLPDVDRTRLACTGESGGGTQTFMLGAVDDRMAVQAPIVMVSHSMQGGCSCENAPGLRVQHSNMEIAAAAAPRPQILVGATGDWTRATMTLEGPAIARIYELLNARERFAYTRFDFDHNYNQTSREAVYAWFSRWLLNRPVGDALAEIPFKKLPDQELRVFPDSRLPEGARTEAEVIAYLKEQVRAGLEKIAPKDPASLEQYKTRMLPAWRHTMQLQETATDRGRVPAEPSKPVDEMPSPRAVVILALPESAGPDQARKAAATWIQAGFEARVVAYSPAPAANPFENFFYVYNRTLAQERVNDIVEACEAARKAHPARKVVLCGNGAAGLWALMASPAADVLAADCSGLDRADDERWLAPDLFMPGIRNIGGLEGIGRLRAPRPTFLHGVTTAFAAADLTGTYKAAGKPGALRVETARSPDEQLLNWVLQSL